MAGHPICIYCHKSVKTTAEDYVIINKRDFEDKWKYAHQACHDKHIDENPPQSN